MEILEFLKEWSPVIIPGLVIVLDVLILLLKNRPKTVDEFRYCLSVVINRLPEFIASVEIPGNGLKKRELVIEASKKMLVSLLGHALSDGENRIVEKTVSGQIEQILSTPQKKGD